MKRLLAASVAAFIAIAVAVGLSELALRMSIGALPMAYLIYLHNDVKDRVPSTWKRIRVQIPSLNDRQEDAEIGWTNKPRQPRVGVNEDGERFSTTVSDEGFFTSSLPDHSTRQIVTLGASFLCTYYVRRPIQDVIQDELGTPIYNLAAGSWGPENYRAAYEKFATTHPHDLVVVFSVLTDPANAVNWRDWKAEDSTESYMTWIQKQAAATDSVNRHQSWGDTHLMTWNLVRFAMRKTPAGGGGGGNAAVLPAQAVGRERLDGPSGSFDLQLSRKQDFTEKDPVDFLPGGTLYPSMQEYFESMVRLKTAIEARHARMVLVWIPSKERVYIPLLPKTRQTAYVINQSGRIDGLENAVSRFAELEGISFLDLTEPLSVRARAGEKLYFTVDGHWNSNGAEAAGKLVSDFIRNLPAPPARRPVEPPLYYRRGPVHADRPLTFSAMTYRAAIVGGRGDRWTVKGKVESQYSYVAGWRDETIDEPQWLLAKGVLRHGGLTFGVLKNDRWSTLINVSAPGRFDVALPVTPGRYSVLVANNVTSGTPDNDAEITSFGWAPMERAR